ncbi:hypothetical protein EP331_12680 [bacterium]|nr:MAG: hypothetical protein EP331_12680 [bacterium]
MLVRSFIPLFVALMAFSSCKEESKTDYTIPKFEPADGTSLFILGQSRNTEMAAYIGSVKSDPTPAGFAYYTNLNYGVPNVDIDDAEEFISQYGDAVLQLAIWTGGNYSSTRPGYYLDEIVKGEKDQGIRQLAEAVKALERPVFIRFGYEFDGYHNAYPPEKYKAAYRYFVDKMRGWGVKNAAYVWHSWGVTPYYGSDDFPEEYPALGDGVSASYDLWYPGDEYVDWAALSIFGTGWGNLNTNTSIQSFISLAKMHGKPIMIAESAAIKTASTRDRSWVIPNGTWFNNMFSLLENNPEIKALTYINVDWEESSTTTTWGNTRIQAASTGAQEAWFQGLNTLQHSSDDLYSKLGYKK